MEYSFENEEIEEIEDTSPNSSEFKSEPLSISVPQEKLKHKIEKDDQPKADFKEKDEHEINNNIENSCVENNEEEEETLTTRIVEYVLPDISDLREYTGIFTIFSDMMKIIGVLSNKIAPSDRKRIRNDNGIECVMKLMELCVENELLIENSVNFLVEMSNGSNLDVKIIENNNGMKLLLKILKIHTKNLHVIHSCCTFLIQFLSIDVIDKLEKFISMGGIQTVLQVLKVYLSNDNYSGEKTSHLKRCQIISSICQCISKITKNHPKHIPMLIQNEIEPMLVTTLSTFINRVDIQTCGWETIKDILMHDCDNITNQKQLQIALGDMMDHYYNNEELIYCGSVILSRTIINYGNYVNSRIQIREDQDIYPEYLGITHETLEQLGCINRITRAMNDYLSNEPLIENSVISLSNLSEYNHSYYDYITTKRKQMEVAEERNDNNSDDKKNKLAPKNIQFIGKHCAIKLLIHFLERYATNYKIVRGGCIFLSNLSKKAEKSGKHEHPIIHDNNIKRIEEDGGIPILMKVLKAHPDDQQLITMIFSIVTTLLDKSISCIKAVVKADGVITFIKLLKQYQNNKELIFPLSHLLRLTSGVNNKTNSRVIGSELPFIIEFFRNYFELEEISKDLIAILSNISKNNIENRNKIGEELALILRVLKGHSNCITIISDITLLLSNIIQKKNQTHRSVMEKEGGVKLIFDIMKWNESNDSINTNCFLILSKVLQSSGDSKNNNQSYMNLFAEEGGVILLLRHLRVNEDSESSVANICNSLSAILHLGDQQQLVNDHRMVYSSDSKSTGKQHQFKEEVVQNLKMFNENEVQLVLNIMRKYIHSQSILLDCSGILTILTLYDPIYNYYIQKEGGVCFLVNIIKTHNSNEALVLACCYILACCSNNIPQEYIDSISQTTSNRDEISGGSVINNNNADDEEGNQEKIVTDKLAIDSLLEMKEHNSIYEIIRVLKRYEENGVIVRNCIHIIANFIRFDLDMKKIVHQNNQVKCGPNLVIEILGSTLNIVLEPEVTRVCSKLLLNSSSSDQNKDDYALSCNLIYTLLFTTSNYYQSTSPIPKPQSTLVSTPIEVVAINDKNNNDKNDNDNGNNKKEDENEVMIQKLQLEKKLEVERIINQAISSLSVNIDIVGEVGAIRRLILGMKKIQTDQSIMKMFIFILTNLANNKSNKAIIYREGCIPPLIQYLQQASKQPEIIQLLFNLLSTVIKNNQENKKAIESEGGVQLILKFIKKYESEIRLVHNGGYLLATLSYNNIDIKSLIGRMKGVQLLLSLMKNLYYNSSELSIDKNNEEAVKQSNNEQEELVNVLFYALGNISVNNKENIRLINAESIKIILKFMKSFFANEILVKNGCYLLSILSKKYQSAESHSNFDDNTSLKSQTNHENNINDDDNNDGDDGSNSRSIKNNNNNNSNDMNKQSENENITVMVQKRGLELLVQALKVYSTNDLIVKHILHLLANICNNKIQNKIKLGEVENSLSIISGIIEHYKTNETILSHWCLLISTVVFNCPNNKKQIGIHSLPSLFHLLEKYLSILHIKSEHASHHNHQSGINNNNNNNNSNNMNSTPPATKNSKEIVTLLLKAIANITYNDYGNGKLVGEYTVRDRDLQNENSNNDSSNNNNNADNSNSSNNNNAQNEVRNGVSIITDYMRHYVAEETITNSICDIIANITKNNKKNIQLIGKEGTLKLLLQILKQYIHCFPIVVNCSEALSNVSFFNQSNTKIIENEEGLLLITKMLQIYDYNQFVIENCFYALANVSYENTAIVRKIRNDALFSLILSYTSTYFENPFLVKKACYLLSHITKYAENDINSSSPPSPVWADEACFGLVGKILNTYKSDEYVINNVFSLVGNLTNAFPAIRSLSTTSSLVPFIISYLKTSNLPIPVDTNKSSNDNQSNNNNNNNNDNNDNNEDTSLDGDNTVEDSNSKVNNDNENESTIKPKVRSEDSYYINNQTIVMNAFYALANIVNDNQNNLKIVGEEGGYFVLVKYMKLFSKNELLINNCCHLLIMIVKYNPYYRKLIEEDAEVNNILKQKVSAYTAKKVNAGSCSLQ